MHDDYQHLYKRFPAENCELVDQVELTSPYLINVTEPHNVYCPTDSRRLIISFRFETN